MGLLKQEELDSRAEKAEALRSRAFDLCAAGDLASLAPLLDGDAEEAPGVTPKLSERRDEKGKSGATLLHM